MIRHCLTETENISRAISTLQSESNYNLERLRDNHFPLTVILAHDLNVNDLKVITKYLNILKAVELNCKCIDI